MADVETDPPQIDTQDPLPEASWFWRRLFIFVTTTVIIIGVWFMVQTMVDLAGDNPALIVGGFVKIIGWLLLYAWFTMTYYMVAPSAEHVTHIWQAAMMFKGGVTSRLSQTATGAHGERATSQTMIGKPVGVGAGPKAPTAASNVTGSPDNPDSPLPWHRNE